VKLFRPCDQSSNDTALKAFFEPIKGPCRRTPLAGRAGGFFGPERLLNQGPRPSKVKVKSKFPSPSQILEAGSRFVVKTPPLKSHSHSHSLKQVTRQLLQGTNDTARATSRNVPVTDMTTLPISVVNCSIADKPNRFKILSLMSNHTHC
jgi:hypothetical protein